MKIQNSNVSGSRSAQTSQVNKKLENERDLSDKSIKNEASKVDMSTQALSFQKAKSIASDSSIDEKRVAELQKLIDSGKYRVDAQAVADRIVEEHLSFPSDL